MTQQFLLTEEPNLFEILLRSAISALTWLYRVINKLTGLLGVVLLLPLFAVLTFLVYITLRIGNSSLEKLLPRISDTQKLDASQVRELMKVHHAIKTRRLIADKMISKPSPDFFLLTPLTKEVEKGQGLLLNAESQLHKVVYPHLYQPLSDEQRRQIIELSKNLEGIWEDDDFCVTK